MITQYYSHGKLMIAGEYLVLKGANALLLPLRTGQHMRVESTGVVNNPQINWQAEVLYQPWFKAVITLQDWSVIHSTSSTVAGQLISILRTAWGMRTKRLDPFSSFNITTNNEFPMNWGFGSSSALTANIAKWTEIDPFSLYFRVWNGSGADVAAALSHGPVIYRLANEPVIVPVQFRPACHQQIWFVYLGKKQHTQESLKYFNNRIHVSETQIDLMNRLTDELLDASDLTGFKKIVKEQELFLADILGKIRIREERFPDFPGEIKSLGAWGGDFVMALSEEDEYAVKQYFKMKGLDTVLSFNEIVLSCE